MIYKAPASGFIALLAGTPHHVFQQPIAECHQCDLWAFSDWGLDAAAGEFYSCIPAIVNLQRVFFSSSWVLYSLKWLIIIETISPMTHCSTRR